MAGPALAEGGSGLAQQATASLVNTSTPQNNPGDGDNSREFLLGDAAAQSGLGSSTATTTGIALVSTAIPMLASPIPGVRAAGATLMGEAGMEFAQAGADKGAQNQNSSGQQFLNNASGDTATDSTGGASNAASSILTPQLQQLLNERGIDATGFAEQLTSGSLTNPSDVLKAVGDNTNYTADDLAQGAQIAQQQQIGATSGSTSSTPNAITYNPSAPTIGGSGGIPGGAGGNNSGLANSKDPLSDSDSAPNAASATAASGTSLAAISNMQGTLAKQNSFLGSAFLSKLLGTQAADAASRLAANILGMKKLGVQKAIAGQNIFQLARHNYHSFEMWRRASFLARN
jgi:hypothetical protein